MKRNEKIVVHSYKHDGSLHRIWTHARVVDEDADGIIIANKRTKVIEGSGRFWFTREPSVTYFYKERWFNIIAMLRDKGIFYYCNIASPYVIDEEALKYIDYDLDLKVFPDFSYKTLDRGEYAEHVRKLGYPASLRDILERELGILKHMVEHREGPFREGAPEEHYKTYERGIA